MKKTYKNPELEVIKIQTQQMLATSDPVSGAKFDPTEETGSMEGRSDEFDW